MICVMVEECLYQDLKNNLSNMLKALHVQNATKQQAINKKKDTKVDKNKWNLQKKEIQITSVQKKRF